jgi:hypothetical protein
MLCDYFDLLTNQSMEHRSCLSISRECGKLITTSACALMLRSVLFSASAAPATDAGDEVGI